MPSYLALPDEIHLRILELAHWRDVVRLGRTCRRFHELCEDIRYWRRMTHKTFDLKTQDVAIDGEWKLLFSSLLRGCLYAWGGGTERMFFGGRRQPEAWGRVRGRPARPQDPHYPTRAEGSWASGLTDIQIGGWSSMMLTIEGKLILAGTLGGMNVYTAGQPRQLEFPTPTNIVQFSMGRSHVIALSDQGEIWTVDPSRESERPILVKFEEFDYVQDDPTKDAARHPFKHGAVKKVIAGWFASAAIVEGYGVVVWFEMSMPDSAQESIRVATKVLPPISEWQGRDATPPANAVERDQQKCEETIKDVIIGEDFLLVLTTFGNMFATDIRNHDQVETVPLTRLVHFSAPDGQKPFNHLSGSFRTFAVFNEEGTVYLGEKDNVRAALERAARGLEVSDRNDEKPQIIEGLQNKGIVDISFGDWHALAMDNRGAIFSWGRESKACGSLGLGPAKEAQRRGVRYGDFNGDGILAEPQQVWIGNEQGTAYITDDIDQQGHFAYKICAGGWRSCALICELKRPKAEKAETAQAVDGAATPSKTAETPAHRNDEASTSGPGTVDLNMGLQPMVERGHPGGIVGMEHTRHPEQSGQVPENLARPGQSFFGVTGGRLELGDSDRLSESRERERERAQEAQE